MRTPRTFAIATLALLIVAFTASAVETCMCVSLIESIRNDLASAVINSKNAEQVRSCLDAKLLSAIESHEAGNYKHAINQLEMFKAKVEMQRTKIPAADALIDSADEAISELVKHL